MFESFLYLWLILDGATLPDAGDDDDGGESNNDEQSVTPGFVYEFNPLRKIVTSLLKEWGIDDSGLDLDDYIHEMYETRIELFLCLVAKCC